jgi:Na+/pantothenate symporter
MADHPGRRVFRRPLLTAVTSDYFKGGGHIPWKLSMVSLFISGFSAFMFVGAAGITYGNGGGAVLLFSFALPAYMLGAWIFGPRWRRTRLDTPLQFLTRRFSQGTPPTFYTMLAVVPNTLVLGIMIYTLCIFSSTALGISERTFDLGIVTLSGFELTLLVTGLVIVIYTTLGGLWAVMVTDGPVPHCPPDHPDHDPDGLCPLGDGNAIEGVAASSATPRKATSRSTLRASRSSSGPPGSFTLSSATT